MKQNKLMRLLGIITLILVMISCKKSVDNYTLPPLSSITTPTSQVSFFVSNAPNGNILKLPVGITTPLTKDVTIHFSYSSETAIAGTHYTAPASITIPAGKVLDSLPITAIYDNIPTGVTHTLTVKITGGDLSVVEGRDSINITLRRFCPVDLSSMLGDYNNTNELFYGSPYGPYTTSITSATLVPGSTTKAIIVVTNIYDAGWAPLSFELDWTDPSNLTATIISQTSGIADAATLSSTYAGRQVMVRPFAGQTGTFDSCEGTFTLRFGIGVSGLGYFDQHYTVTLKR